MSWWTRILKCSAETNISSVLIKMRWKRSLIKFLIDVVEDQRAKSLCQVTKRKKVVKFSGERPNGQCELHTPPKPPTGHNVTAQKCTFTYWGARRYMA